jgi:glycosyltransferase involved in cell wall biosynthesis
MKVLHFKTNYLNLSEIFINRLVHNHQQFDPVIGTCNPLYYTEDVNLYAMPDNGLSGFWNNLQLKLNQTPAFLYDVVEKEQPDLIHGHFGLDCYRLIGLKKATQLPFIVNFYGYDVLRLPKEFGWKSRYKRLSNFGDLYFVGSADMKENVADLGFPKDKIRVLKLGMNLDEIRFEQRKTAGRKLMMVGRMVEKKGFKYAIHAVSRLKNDGTNVQLDLYGDGTLRSELETLSEKLEVTENVVFHGQTDNDVVFDELYKHDILLVPSVQAEDGDREGIPQTTVEGMATGIPVIASDHAGLPELVDDQETGLLVPQRDADALAQAVDQYLSNPEIVPAISKNGRERVEQEHHINKQVQKAEDWYKSVL